LLLICYGVFNLFIFSNVAILKLWRNFPCFGIKRKLHIKNENVELVPILFEQHCDYSPKIHYSWDYLKVYFDEYFPWTFWHYFLKKNLLAPNWHCFANLHVIGSQEYLVWSKFIYLLSYQKIWSYNLEFFII
jgi:hypothetical protein